MTLLPIRAAHVVLLASMLLGLSCTGDSPAPGDTGGGSPAASTATAASSGSSPSVVPASGLAPATPATPATTSIAALPGPSADKVLVVWESNRSGEFRIWRQDLPGGEPRPISTEEPGRDHCCAKLSPDGSRLVYLSLPGGARKYSAAAGELHLVDADGGRDRVLVREARHYGEHRAAVWWGEDELVHLDGNGATRHLRLSSGASAGLATAGANGEGWLVAPGGNVATGNTPTFSEWSAERGVLARPSLGGCQPAFSNDGRYAVWSAGAGGPIDVLDLATRRSWTVLEKGDPHLPADRGYSYFPMLSNDASLLAVGVSAGEHDHFRADYDIYVLELDPRTLLPVPAPSGSSTARVVAPHPAVDRFPDLYRTARPMDRGTATSVVAAPPEPPTGGAEIQRGLAFLWQSAEAENRIAAGSASEVLQAQGLAWIDRHRALALGGGSYSAAAESGRRLAAALVAKHQMTLSLLVTPASLGERGAIVALADGPQARNFVLRQEGATLVLVLRTSDSAKAGLAVPVATLTSPAPRQLLLSFSPGRLSAFVDGAPTAETTPPIAVPGDFFHWRPRSFTFGAEARSPERWHGTLAEIRIWNRPLAGPEIAAEAARIQALLAARPGVPRTHVEVRRLASSPAPSLEEISPYREALVVDELGVVRQLAGPPLAAERIRVARWAILDNQVLSPPPGDTYTLVLEPFAEQPQLEQFFLGDELPPATGVPLFFDLGATAKGAAGTAP
jgi:hypothetical protein